MNGQTSRTFLGAIALILFASTAIAVAHDHWINRGGFRGPQNGEWCCGTQDCFVVPYSAVKLGNAGFELFGAVEVVPYTEVLPSADGQYWRCQRPNGTRRCFFAPITAF